MLIDLNELSPKIQSVGNKCHCSQSSGKVSELKTPESQSQWGMRLPYMCRFLYESIHEYLFIYCLLSKCPTGLKTKILKTCLKFQYWETSEKVETNDTARDCWWAYKNYKLNINSLLHNNERGNGTSLFIYSYSGPRWLPQGNLSIIRLNLDKMKKPSLPNVRIQKCSFSISFFKLQNRMDEKYMKIWSLFS